VKKLKGEGYRGIPPGARGTKKSLQRIKPGQIPAEGRRRGGRKELEAKENPSKY